MAKKQYGGAERRKNPRVPIVESFSFFVSVPQKGPQRLKVHDLSTEGVGFDWNVDGEDPDTFVIKEGEKISVELYLNQSLFISVDAKVARIIRKGPTQLIGAEIISKSKAYEDLLSLVHSLEKEGHLTRVL